MITLDFSKSMGVGGVLGDLMLVVPLAQKAVTKSPACKESSNRRRNGWNVPTRIMNASCDRVSLLN